MKGGQLVLFDTQIYHHIRNSHKYKTLNDIGKFIVSNFFDETDKESLKKLASREPDNLFYKLILSCMPKPEAGESAPEPYYQAFPLLKEQFKKDLQTLIEDVDLFVGHFHQLIKFYFFKYVSELAIRLHFFFNDEPEPLYFSVKWEKLTGSRAALRYGWEFYEGYISSLFSHAVVLELVNYIQGFGVQPVAYKEIKEIVAGLSAAEEENLAASLDELTNLYTGSVKDVNWDNFRNELHLSEPNPVLRKVKFLFGLVEYQFRESTRGRASQAYQGWLWEFSRNNFSKPRGQWGNSFALDQDYILLLTRLCVGSNEKIRLKELWSGFQSRGIVLDSISRDHIVQYFEKINLLEKKSDSGDAQYVLKFSQTLV